ncbi:MAG: hypothetical protein RLZZ299_325 [Pseudomonadota bacterium]
MREGLRQLLLLALAAGTAHADTPSDPAPCASCAWLAPQHEDPFPTLESLLTLASGTLPVSSPDPADTPVHHLAWTLTDLRGWTLTAEDGGPAVPTRDARRALDVDLRVGTPQLDHTHKVLDEVWGGVTHVSAPAPLDAVGAALRATVLDATDEAYRAARARLAQVRRNAQVKVAREDASDDFSPAPPLRLVEAPPAWRVDLDAWRAPLTREGARLAALPAVHQSAVELEAAREVRWLLTRDGTRVQDSRTRIRLAAWASTTADDGMQLSAWRTVDVTDAARLPDAAALTRMVDALAEQIRGVRDAPLVDPYSGPAILRGRAAGVFFHEIFGHRIEGHRQKDEDEGQTFTRKVGQPILPPFLDVVDDPTLTERAGTDLVGTYRADDEGVAAQRVPLVERGILRNFLLSRTPIRGFPASNGHGRRQVGQEAVSRQGNLLVEAHQAVPYARLRAMLLEEARRQGKPYGLVFDDISGGFTFTGRATPNAFVVQPTSVWRVWVDGRPDERVRGVDLIGTPLTTFAGILAAGDDPEVFNGVCGAESGWVPVSASAPSLLVRAVEVQRTPKGNDRPPLLPRPDVTP